MMRHIEKKPNPSSLVQQWHEVEILNYKYTLLALEGLSAKSGYLNYDDSGSSYLAYAWDNRKLKFTVSMF